MNLIDKKKIKFEDLLGGKALKNIKTKDLEEMLSVVLTTVHDDDVSVNLIIAELLNRGLSKDDIKKQVKEDKSKSKIEKAFDILGIDMIEKGKHLKYKYLTIKNGEYIYDDSKMTSKDHEDAKKYHEDLAAPHSFEEDRAYDDGKESPQHTKMRLKHSRIASHHQEMAYKKSLIEKKDTIEKGTPHPTHKYLKIVNGHYIYKENEMTSKDHKEAASHHKTEFEKLNKTNKVDEKHRKKLKYHQDVSDRHEKLAEEKKGNKINHPTKIGQIVEYAKKVGDEDDDIELKVIDIDPKTNWIKTMTNFEDGANSIGHLNNITDYAIVNK